MWRVKSEEPKEYVVTVGLVGLERHIANLLQVNMARSAERGAVLVSGLSELLEHFVEVAPEIVIYDLDEWEADQSFRDQIYALEGWRGVRLINLRLTDKRDWPPGFGGMLGGPR
ncbi:MAG: hypothetical protein KF784_02365 [Fimbriimonadaceae bacterium]|nr:hypothetical protein [Fimbriimonadaceae bacterium]